MTDYTPEALGLPYTFEKDGCASCEKTGKSEYFIPEVSSGYHAQFGDLNQVKFITIAANSFHEMREALRMVTKSTEWSCMERSTQEAIEAALSKADQLEKTNG